MDNTTTPNSQAADAVKSPAATADSVGSPATTADVAAAPSSNVTVIERGTTTWHIVGTAHVSDESRREVEHLIQELKPDIVCVELCQERYDSFKDENRWSKLDIFQVIRRGKFLLLLANLALGSYQRRIGAKLGVKPGAELMGAVELAEQYHIPVALIDRNINTTLKRVWANLSFWNKCKAFGGLLDILLGDEEEDHKSSEETREQIEQLKASANINDIAVEIAKEMPQIHKPLIDERDQYLARKMRDEKGRTILAVVGAAHVKGIVRYFDEEIDTASLDVVPPPSIVWNVLKWLIPAVILGGLVYGGFSHGADTLKDLLLAWVLPNSVFCFLFTLAALAKPLTILAAIFVSPLTSTTPLIGAGVVLGLLEAWLRKPTVADCENLVNVHTLRDFYKNPVTHILIVCVLSTFGSALGAYVGIGWMLALLGLAD